MDTVATYAESMFTTIHDHRYVARLSYVNLSAMTYINI